MWLENYFVLPTDAIPSVLVIITAGLRERLHDNCVWAILVQSLKAPTHLRK